jgi:hypothetical protein
VNFFFSVKSKDEFSSYIIKLSDSLKISLILTMEHKRWLGEIKKSLTGFMHDFS